MTTQNGHRAIAFEADCFSLFRNHVAVRKKPAYTSFKHSIVTLGFWIAQRWLAAIPMFNLDVAR